MPRGNLRRVLFTRCKNVSSRSFSNIVCRIRDCLRSLYMISLAIWSKLYSMCSEHAHLNAVVVQTAYYSLLKPLNSDDTEWGQVMASVSEDNGKETPVQVHLNWVATFIGKIGLSVATLVLVILIIRSLLLFVAKNGNQTIDPVEELRTSKSVPVEFIGDFTSNMKAVLLANIVIWIGGKKVD